MTRSIIQFLIIAAIFLLPGWLGMGCAQIGAPTGGPRDSLPPRLIKAIPETNKRNFTGNRITLQFNEYVELQELQQNLMISPVPKNNPVISSNLRTVTIKLRDSLLPNTTYQIQFGNSIKDVNEGNVLDNFTYVFSTGDQIDSLTLSGTVRLAETGRTDSTLFVYLYKNAHDTAVQTRKPDYSARVKGDGRFQFRYLPGTDMKLYALRDGDGSRTYNAPTELFAFADQTVNPAQPGEPITLFAYAEKKESGRNTSTKTLPEKKLLYTSNQLNRLQDLYSPLILDFNNPLASFDSSAFIITDSNALKVPYTFSTDSTRKKVTIQPAWLPDMKYTFILQRDYIIDSAGNRLSRNDSLPFRTRKTTDYGRAVLRFQNLDLSRKPVLVLMQGEQLVLSAPLKSNEWSYPRLLPAEYEIRIVFDENSNGRWDPGSYPLRRQPEKAITLDQKLAVRADWDNERDITL